MNLDTAISESDALRAITDVAGYIAQQNEDTNSRAKAEGWTFWTLLPTDGAWVARFATAYDLELYYAQAGWFETYREVRGYKPRGVSAPASLEECNEAIASLCAEEDARKVHEAEREDEEARLLAEAMDASPLTHNPFAGLLG